MHTSQHKDCMRKRLLFVDDEPAVLSSFQRMLRREQNVWDMTFLDCPHDALAQLMCSDFDAVVTDVQMPGMDGLQLLQRLRQAEQTRDVPVVVVTGLTDHDLKRRALDLGATDLLNKPAKAEDLLARLHSVLRLKACQDELKRHSELLEQKVRERTRQLEASHLDIIWRLGKAAEFRDTDTGNHILRVGYFSHAIAEALGLEREFFDRLFLAAPLHDIGKLGVPDSILLKPGKLTDDEWCVMRQHCEIGAAILQQHSNMGRAFAHRGSQAISTACQHLENPLLELAATIALTHHEKWNGEGYPRGLAKEEIPLAGRIVAISDVYDALTSERPYKPAFSEEKARAIIRKGIGQHFDPEVYAAFEASLERIRAIRDEFSDQQGTVCSDSLFAVPMCASWGSEPGREGPE